MCNLLGIRNSAECSYRGYYGYRLLVSPSWETKPLWMGWHDHACMHACTGYIVSLHKHEHLSAHTYPHAQNNISPTFQHKFDYKLHRKRWFIGTVSFLSDLITCVISAIDSQFIKDAQAMARLLNIPFAALYSTLYLK